MSTPQRDLDRLRAEVRAAVTEMHEQDETFKRAAIILNSSEEGTPAHDLALAAVAIRGAQRCVAMARWADEQGLATISVEWVRAQFSPFEQAS